jgi:predicted nucleic acid-binding protein
MVYIDTSVLVSYYCPEPLSEAAERIILRSDKPSLSALTEVELASALSRKMREKEISQVDANRVITKFQSHLDQFLFKRIPLEREHCSLAFNWLIQLSIPLKTLDALHLAVAAGNNLQVITADRQLANSAQKLGLANKLLS